MRLKRSEALQRNKNDTCLIDYDSQPLVMIDVDDESNITRTFELLNHKKGRWLKLICAFIC